MTKTLVQHLTNKLGQRHFWFTEPCEKHTSVTLKLFKHDEVAKLTSLPFILGHVVALFPDLFFSEAEVNTTQMFKCFFNKKCGENASRVKKREKEEEKEGKTKGKVS